MQLGDHHELLMRFPLPAVVEHRDVDRDPGTEFHAALTFMRTDVDVKKAINSCSVSLADPPDNPNHSCVVVSRMNRATMQPEYVYLDADRTIAVHNRCALRYRDGKFTIICRLVPADDDPSFFDGEWSSPHLRDALEKLQGKISIRLSPPVLTWTRENIDRLPVGDQEIANTIMEGQQQQQCPLHRLGAHPLRLLMEYLTTWSFTAIAPQDTVTRQLVITNRLGRRLPEDELQITSHGIWQPLSIYVPSLPPGESFSTTITLRPVQDAEPAVKSSPFALQMFGGVHAFLRTELRHAQVTLDHLTGITAAAPQKVIRWKGDFRCHRCGLISANNSDSCVYCFGTGNVKSISTAVGATGTISPTGFTPAAQPTKLCAPPRQHFFAAQAETPSKISDATPSELAHHGLLRYISRGNDLAATPASSSFHFTPLTASAASALSGFHFGPTSSQTSSTASAAPAPSGFHFGPTSSQTSSTASAASAPSGFHFRAASPLTTNVKSHDESKLSVPDGAKYN